MSINDLSGEVNTLRKNYQLCKTELNSMKKDQAPKPAKDAQKKDEGEAVDPRKALFAAIQNRGTNGDESSSKPAPVDPRKALFVFGAEASNASIPSSNVKYSRGVKRLESFIWKAEASLSLTERDQGTAIEACKVSCGFFYDEDIIHYVLSSHTDCYILFSQDLAKYCGEEGGERAASKLLQNISDFASELKAAVKKYDKRAELSRRQKARNNKSIPQKVHKENQVNAALPKKNQSLVASSLQPHVGLSDKTKSVSSGPNNTSSEQATSKSSRRAPMKTSRTQKSSSNDGDARSDRMTNKVRTINTNVQQQESRVSMVHEMLEEAPANVSDGKLPGVYVPRVYCSTQQMREPN